MNQLSRQRSLHGGSAPQLGLTLPSYDAVHSSSCPQRTNRKRQQHHRRRAVAVEQLVEETVRPDVHPTAAASPDLLRQRVTSPDLRDPEGFSIPAGALSSVLDVPAQEAPFRCLGCTRTECQGGSGCAPMSWRLEPGGYLAKILTATVYDVAAVTPLEEAVRLSAQVGSQVLLKREDLQAVFSFKLRGAYNKMAGLDGDQRARGVVCSSAGNHAQGVALAAQRLGVEAVICMPETTPAIKVQAVKALGGQVKLVGESYSETQAFAQELAVAEGKTFVAPYDDPLTIAGQGTVGTEILRQISTAQLSRLHAIFVPVGGGGLIAGIAAYVKALYPQVKVIGVETVGANAMAMSLAEGRRVTLSKVDAFADGTAVKQVGAETFRLCQGLVDGVVLVDNAATSAAIRDIFNETRSILEPSGALGVAGAKAYLQRHGLKDQTVVAVTSGANMNFDRLRLVAELAGVGATQEAMLVTTIPELPGSFMRFASTALADSDLSITEFKYRFAAGEAAHILWSASIRRAQDTQAMVQRLQQGGMPTLDISGLEPAQVHLRHLVGGRARSFLGQIPDERIFQVVFPERPGALRTFLSVISPQWNITLFHYRKTGDTSTGILIGMQLPPETETAFNKAKEQLRENFTFDELAGDARNVFNMFIS